MVVGERSADGVGIDATYQHFSERPYQDPDGETVDVVDDQEIGEVTTEGVDVPDEGVVRPDVDGQTTFEDWRWSS